MTRRSLIWSGGLGLAGALLLTAGCLLLVATGLIPILLTYPILIWTIFIILLLISLIEIPTMVYALRKIAAGNNPKSTSIVWATNAFYVFFAAVYAAPFILLAGRSSLELAAGGFLGALSVVRMISAVIFIPVGNP